jgi:hypothetical protein
MKHWILAGSHPKDYVDGIDAAITYEEKKAAHLRCQVDEPGGFGTLMQSFKADHYHNKRMRFSAAVKSEGVTEWAGLWMRVDGDDTKSLEFDNMQERPIKGDTDWQRYQVVLDVPLKGISVHFGILLAGKGQVWLSDVRFEDAPNEPTTSYGKQLLDEPLNLDFSEE